MAKKRKTRKQKIKASLRRESGRLEYHLSGLAAATTDVASPAKLNLRRLNKTNPVLIPHLELIKKDLLRTVVLAGLIIGAEIALYGLNLKYGWLG